MLPWRPSTHCSRRTKSSGPLSKMKTGRGFDTRDIVPGPRHHLRHHRGNHEWNIYPPDAIHGALVVGERVGFVHPGLLRHHAHRDRMDYSSTFCRSHRAGAPSCSHGGRSLRICVGIWRHHVWPGNQRRGNFHGEHAGASNQRIPRIGHSYSRIGARTTVSTPG